MPIDVAYRIGPPLELLPSPDRAKRERQGAASNLSDINVAATRDVFSTGARPDVEVRRLADLASSARPALAPSSREPAARQTSAGASGRAGQAETDDQLTEAVAPFQSLVSLEDIAPPSAEEVARAFSAVAALAPFGALAGNDDEGSEVGEGLTLAGLVERLREGDLDDDDAVAVLAPYARAEPGALMSRFA